MKKKLLAMLLGVTMTVSMLAGCGGAKDDSAANAPAQTEAAEQKEEAAAGEEEAPAQEAGEAANDAAAQAIADRKAEAEKTGTYQKVVFSFYTWTGRPAGTDRIQEKINEQLRETLGLEVELLVMDAASYAQNVRLMLSSGEQIDLYNSCPLGYTSVVNDGFCYDLEEDDLIQTYGPGILEALKPEYVNACRISGTLYGLPQLRDFAMGTDGYCLAESYLDGIGFDYKTLYEESESSDIIYTDYDTIEDIFARLHEEYPDKYVFGAADNLINQGTIADPVGGDWFGVLLDPANSLTVENLFTSDLFKERCQRVYEWNQKGYISKDSLTDDTALGTRIKAGTLMSMMSQTKPGYKRQSTAENGQPMTIMQTGEDIMKSASITGILWHINQNCEDPIATMQVLNAFYTDPVVSNLIMWGEEGVDYVMTDDGHITFPEGVSSENSEWNHTMNWLLPNQFIAHIWEGDSLDLWERTEKFNEEAIKSKALGFSWDNSDYASEYTALKNVYDEYAKQLMLGFLDPEVGIPEMEAKLEAAGLNEYIAAKQAALDEWAAANGVK